MDGGGRSGRGRWDWVPVAVCACYGAAVLASVLVPGFPAGPVRRGGSVREIGRAHV